MWERVRAAVYDAERYVLHAFDAVQDVEVVSESGQNLLHEALEYVSSPTGPPSNTRDVEELLDRTRSRAKAMVEGGQEVETMLLSASERVEFVRGALRDLKPRDRDDESLKMQLQVEALDQLLEIARPMAQRLLVDADRLITAATPWDEALTPTFRVATALRLSGNANARITTVGHTLAAARQRTWQTVTHAERMRAPESSPHGSTPAR